MFCDNQLTDKTGIIWNFGVSCSGRQWFIQELLLHENQGSTYVSTNQFRQRYSFISSTSKEFVQMICLLKRTFLLCHGAFRLHFASNLVINWYFFGFLVPAVAHIRNVLLYASVSLINHPLRLGKANTAKATTYSLKPFTIWCFQYWLWVAYFAFFQSINQTQDSRKKLEIIIQYKSHEPRNKCSSDSVVEFFNCRMFPVVLGAMCKHLCVVMSPKLIGFVEDK